MGRRLLTVPRPSGEGSGCPILAGVRETADGRHFWSQSRPSWSRSRGFGGGPECEGECVGSARGGGRRGRASGTALRSGGTAGSSDDGALPPSHNGGRGPPLSDRNLYALSTLSPNLQTPAFGASPVGLRRVFGGLSVQMGLLGLRRTPPKLASETPRGRASASQSQVTSVLYRE